MIVILLAVAFLLAGPSTAQAFTCTPTGCTFEALYTEPTVGTTGSPLTNLTSCTVSYSIAIGAGAPGLAQTVVVPASSPTGGGAIVRPITDSALIPGFNYTISGGTACANPAGTGPTLSASPLPIARAGEVPPAPPTGGSFR